MKTYWKTLIATGLAIVALAAAGGSAAAGPGVNDLDCDRPNQLSDVSEPPQIGGGIPEVYVDNFWGSSAKYGCSFSLEV